jgi:purine-cytosine permease-like protein
MLDEKQMNVASKAKKTAAKLKAETIRTFSMLMTSAFGLVAAFAWNEAVKDAISRYISSGQGLKSKLIYAIFVTLIAVLVSYQLGALSAKYADTSDDDKK